MKILIIGNGRLGQSLSNELKNQGHLGEVEVVSSRWFAIQSDSILERIVLDPDYIIWCARDAGIPTDLSNTQALWSRIQLAILRNRWIGKFIFVSSAGAVYGQGGENANTEDSPTMPIDEYGVLKVLHERELEDNSNSTGFRVLILRLANLYSLTPDDSGIVGASLLSMESGKPFKLMSGLQTRDFIHLQDACQALIQLLLIGAEGVYNIASGVSISIFELISKLENKFGNRVLYEIIPGNPKIMHNLISVEKVKGALGWNPSTIDSYLLKS